MKRSCAMTARGLRTAADEFQKFLVEQLNNFLCYQVANEEGNKSTCWQHLSEWYLVSSLRWLPWKGVPARQGAGTGGTQPVPCSPPAAAPEGAVRAGQAEFAGKRARQGLQTFQLEKWELVLFLEIGTMGGKGGKNDPITSVIYPKKAFWGAVFAIQDTHKKSASKM